MTGEVTAARSRARRRHALRLADWQVALLVGGAAFALYAATAAPSVATLFDDSLEFQVVLPTLGIAHPSGYPLYTLAGKLFTILLPLRDPAGRVNLLSALMAAAAVAVLYRVARMLGGNRAAALVATAAFAISPTWWSQATIAEVYALHGLLVGLFVWLLLKWEVRFLAEGARQRASGRTPARNDREGNGQQEESRRTRTPNRRPSDRLLGSAAFVAGLGLAHHRMIVLFFPAALVFVLWTDPALVWQPRRWVRPLVLLLAPLLLYAYLPLRGQAVTSLDGTYEPTLAGTLDWVLARGYSVFLTDNPFGVERGWTDYLALFLHELGALLTLAAVAGLVSAWKFSPRRAAFLLLALVGQIVFAANYKVQDVEVFFLPAFMLVAVWAAWGLASLFDAFSQRAAHSAQPLHLPQWARPLLTALWLMPVAFVLLFEPGRAALRAFPRFDRSRTWAVYDQGVDMVNSAAAGGEIIGLGGEVTLVRYFRDVLGQRPDLRVTRADAEDDRRAAVAAALAGREPVYLTRELPGAPEQYSLDAAGPLIAVSPKAAPEPAPAGRDIGAGVRFIAGDSFVRQTHGGPVVRVKAQWSATQAVSEALKVSARLLGDTGEVLVATDVVPVHFGYPTTAWVPGETVTDVYDLPVPAGHRGSLSVLLILYRAANGSEVGRIELGTLAP